MRWWYVCVQWGTIRRIARCYERPLDDVRPTQWLIWWPFSPIVDIWYVHHTIILSSEKINLHNVLNTIILEINSLPDGVGFFRIHPHVHVWP